MRTQVASVKHSDYLLHSTVSFATIPAVMESSPLNHTDISRLAFIDEAEALHTLVNSLHVLSDKESDIMARARNWTRTIRRQGAGNGIESFLHTYGLDTEEGVALMCLAEALLRIPDTGTADALIRDTFEGREWSRYTHSHDSWLIGLSSWGLLITGKVIDFGNDPQAGVTQRLRGLVARTGEPIIREALKKAMQFIGGQFVLGETVAEALANSRSYHKQGYRFSYDILGEGARSDTTAKGYVNSYLEGIALIGNTIKPGTPLWEAPGISVKLSALHPRYQLTQRERVMTELLPRLQTIVLAAKKAGITVSIDAEEASRLDIELHVFEQLAATPELQGWNGIGFVVQAYQKRAFHVIDWLTNLARQHQRILPIRLVKGAYWDSEIKWAQILGLPSYPVFTRKEHTDTSYLACAHKILATQGVFFPQFATHNARSAASIVTLAKHYGWKKGTFEFQRLHGMGETLHGLWIDETPSRIYAPVGAHEDLLAYLIRRLLENGANSSFVHLLMDENKTEEEILADPVLQTMENMKKYQAAIPLPAELYGTHRRNSSGIDFGNAAQLTALQTAIAPYTNIPQKPITETTPDQLQRLLTNSKSIYAEWQQASVEVRASMLERAAELLENHQAELVALLATEAGKTLNDGIAEVREAADFCRYYAAEAKRILRPYPLQSPAGESNVLSLHPRGTIACISPWNFPLAIFIGQITAALATGNTVVAKPAEQTPRIAARAVALLHEAGVPPAALTLAIGNGESIGAALVASPMIDGVVFTGSSETAQVIHRSLAARKGSIVPLIAETGGQNCMVVDSSALIEHAVDDIIASAFGSAGQRCSALRVLFVDAHIADALLTLLAEAMQELCVGDPLQPDTDIGPLIDAMAQANIQAHIDRLTHSSKRIAATPLPTNLTGCFIAPHAFEIHSIAEIPCEIFGPVLHIIRYHSGDLMNVADAINSTGFGLTFGIHSRIDDHIHLLTSRVRAGNIYVNRSMTGAVVGVQPFGGEGLSGTGPKAGGPHYLLRFLTERNVTINTAAIGGNVTLLTK